MSKQKVVVVGNGMVGHKFIDNLLAHPNADSYEIITLGCLSWRIASPN